MGLVKSIDINFSESLIDIEIAMSTVDKALTEGCELRLLRWRVSPAQGCSMIRYALMTATNPSPPYYYVETGAMYESGMFCGIPFVVDRKVPPDTVLLERLEPIPVARVYGLLPPRGYAG